MALILTVDDSAYMRRRIGDVLKSNGHEVIEAEDGLKGLKMAVSRRPDCILLDLIMPVMDGIKFLDALRKEDSSIPVIVVTADVQESVRKQCLDFGVASFINKPPRTEELSNAVKVALAPKADDYREITPVQIDILKELINIGIGRAAGVLNEMINFHVQLTVPLVKVLTHSALMAEMEEFGSSRVASVQLGFMGPFSGTAALVFPPDSASKLVEVLTGEEPGTPDLDSVRAGTLTEVGNIVINGVMGSIGNILKQRMSYSLPIYTEDTINNLLMSASSDFNPMVLLVRTRFNVRQLQVEGNIILLFEVGSFDALIDAIDIVDKDPGVLE